MNLSLEKRISELQAVEKPTWEVLYELALLNTELKRRRSQR